MFISSGHDEYWSQNQRNSMESARAAGVNLAFFSGNTGFWKTRFEPSADGTNTAARTLVTYKDTHFEAQQDPVEWTGTWRDPRFTVPPNRPVPENALLGLSFLVNFGTSAITVPAAYKNLRIWRNTAATSLAAGTSLTLAPSTLGYEWDVDADNGFRPPGTFRLSSTTVSGLEAFTDYGSTVTPRTSTATHNMISYRAPSGALVFNSGTVQWAWGLDDFTDFGTINDTMRQATVNLFADMGAQPYKLLPRLVAATKSADATKPRSTITSPPTSLADGTKVTLAGTATDTGGTVAGIEVSTDDGATWHPATTGTANWTYSWVAHGSPSTTIRTRATDDSGNIEVPGVGAVVAVACPCSLWGDNITPPVADSGDNNAAELGMKFTSDRYGVIKGVRFHKSALNTGTHVGSLWTAGGTRLAQVTFANETATGWQTASFSSPVQVLPNTTYVVSYHAPKGRFAATSAYFYASPAPGPNGGAVADSPPLHAVRNSGGATNGMFAYTATSTFPAASFGASNYWVDAIFEPTPPPGPVADVTATSGGLTSANVSWSAPSTGGGATEYTVTPRINGVAQTPKTVTGTPPLTTTTVAGLTNGTTYTFTVRPANPAGPGPESAASNAVTPLTAVVPAKPTGVDARPAGQRALVSWTAPASDGDSSLTGYKITPYVGATAQTPTTVGPSTTSATVTDLTNGTAHTFAVEATNGIGTGPASAPSQAVTPQGTIFDFATPQVDDPQDPNPVEVGVKFVPDVDGWVTGVRFYKSTVNTGVHTGSLWTTTGTRLAQATFTKETASGWQTVTFATPVAVTAGTTYVASYYAPVGRYSSKGAALESAVVNGPLRAVANATSPNGVYMYGATSLFPSRSFNASNYFVDVLFAVPVPGQVTNASAVEAGRTSASVSWSVPSSGGAAASFIVTPRINGVAQASKTVTGSPPATSTTVAGLTNGTTYTFTVTAANANGMGPASAPTNTVTPLTAVVPTAPTAVDARPATESARVSWDVPGGDGDSPITGYTITPYAGSTALTPTAAGGSATSATVVGLTNGVSHTFRVSATNAVGTSPASAPSPAVTPRYTVFDFGVPATADAGESTPINLGVKFRAGADGSITGVRFYKSTLNTGTHTGSLWSVGGALLAQATFANESATGWQTATFTSPVAITQGTTYVASYFAPNGHYSVSGGAFASSVTNGPLTALADATSPNGVYSYAAASGFPNSSFNASNYWVDPMFAHAPRPGTPTAVTATAGPTSATVSWTAPTTGGAPTSYTITPRIGGVAQTSKTIDGSPPATSTAISGLTPGTAYTFTVTASNAGGTSPTSSASNAVTPTGATVPGAPTAVAAVADTTSATVSWTAPANDGGSAITGYTITPYVGASAQPASTAGASSTSTRVTGLTNGTSYTFRVVATNSVGDGAASAASSAVAPPYSLLEFTTPAVIDGGDDGSVNVGMKFQSDVTGSVTGARFYKAAANTGTHVGSLWSATGTLLAQGSFTAETASGWQSLTFASPVTIAAGTTYVVSYLAPKGRYSVTSAAFGGPGGIFNAPLRGLSDAVSPNGVYSYAATSVFPVNSFNAGNYWVDLLFTAGP